MKGTVVLLVEDNPDDEALTLRVLRKWRLSNPVVVARDAGEALDYIFGEGAYAGRDVDETPALVLLDLRLPKIASLDVLRRIRQDRRTEFVPVIILTSSSEDLDCCHPYAIVRANGYLRKPIDFHQFCAVLRQQHLAWLLLKDPPTGAIAAA